MFFFCRTSLRLEPIIEVKNKKISQHCYSHYDIRALQNGDVSTSNTSFSKITEVNNYSELLNKSLNEESLKPKETSNAKFKPGHRKTYSLETNQFISNNCSSNSNVNGGINNKMNLKVNLIDDSIIYDCSDNNNTTYYVSPISTKRDKKPTLEMFRKKSEDCIFENGLTEWQDTTKYEKWCEKDIIHKGCVNRKTIFKDKKKPSVSFTSIEVSFCSN